jgi:Flp pilus assembly protein TadG
VCSEVAGSDRFVERRRMQHGAIAVEFALIVPLLIALLLAIVTGGVAYSRSLSLSDAVRAGGRFGATTVNSGSWPSAVQQYTAALSADGLTAAQVCVQLARGSTVLQSNCGTGVAAPANPVGVAPTDCVVKVWARREVQFSAVPLIPISDITLDRSTVLRYERTC